MTKELSLIKSLALVFGLGIITTLAVLILTNLGEVFGFVDGNNNGRDDVKEWENSPQYDKSYPYLEDDKINRQKQCDIFNGIWNNTGWGSCTFRDGKHKGW